MPAGKVNCEYSNTEITYDHYSKHILTQHRNDMIEQFSYITDDIQAPYINKDKTYTFCFHCNRIHKTNRSKQITGTALYHVIKCPIETQRAALKKFMSNIIELPTAPIAPIAPTTQHIHITHHFEINDELIELIKLLKSSP